MVLLINADGEPGRVCFGTAAAPPALNAAVGKGYANLSNWPGAAGFSFRRPTGRRFGLISRQLQVPALARCARVTWQARTTCVSPETLFGVGTHRPES